jgi:drug/metabolite transporter (DMT)-like permease
LFAFIPIIATLAVTSNWNTLINNKIHIQLLRGVLGVICGALIINSFKRHALIEIYPILFSTPLILTILSYFVLKEKVGIRRWSAVLIGFIGVLIVSRPGTIHFTLPLFGLFFAAIILAVNVLIIRRLANTQSSIAFAFYGTVGGLVISGFFSFQNFVSVPLADMLIFVACGIIGGIGSLCITGASKILESSVFAPIQYVQLVAGFIMGYLFFKDLPDAFEIIGSLVIVFSGLFIIYRENKLNIRPFVSNKSRIRDMFFRGH